MQEYGRQLRRPRLLAADCFYAGGWNQIYPGIPDAALVSREAVCAREGVAIPAAATALRNEGSGEAEGGSGPGAEIQCAPHERAEGDRGIHARWPALDSAIGSL